MICRKRDKNGVVCEVLVFAEDIPDGIAHLYRYGKNDYHVWINICSKPNVVAGPLALKTLSKLAAECPKGSYEKIFSNFMFLADDTSGCSERGSFSDLKESFGTVESIMSGLKALHYNR